MTATAEAPADPASGKVKPSGLRNLVEWVVTLVGALLVALLVQAFLFQPFFIPSESMVPTLQIHDRVLVNKLSYRLHEVNRGDVVVFERSDDDPSTIRDLIKRVVAVEGDTIESQGDTVFVNGQAVQEPYRRSSSLGEAVARQTLAADEVFVMGDNRTASKDSRSFGPIHEDRIVGRAFVRFWPLGHLGFL